MKEFRLFPQISRRFPDPVYPGAQRHIFMLAAHELPPDLPKDANPRKQDIDKRVYKDIAKHLLNQEGTANTFHLKNKGMTLLADSVERVEDDEYIVRISDSGGLVDGAHTYEILLKNSHELKRLSKGDQALTQFVKLEILTGLPNELTPEIAGGLNTAVQVQLMSLANLRDEFDWVKPILESEGYLDLFAFEQNDDKQYDARDLIRILDLFNLSDFPSKGKDYPIRAYSSKESVLKHYLKDNNKDKYKKLAPIIGDILRLHDIVSKTARDLYNAPGGKRGGRLMFVEQAAQGKKHRFHFLMQEGEYQLATGTLLPMLGAFRALCEEDTETGLIKWRTDFGQVEQVWKDVGGQLVEATQETSIELGRNPNAIGKSKKHWAFLFNQVRDHYLESIGAFDS